MKYNEPLLIKIIPVDYCVGEDHHGELPSDNLRNPLFDCIEEVENSQSRKYTGGRFDWQLIQWPENYEEDLNVKLQLMRLWCTTMYTQLASNLSFTNEIDSNIKVGLTEDELNTLININNKISKGIISEIIDYNNSFMRKKKIKKINI